MRNIDILGRKKRKKLREIKASEDQHLTTFSNPEGNAESIDRYGNLVTNPEQFQDMTGVSKSAEEISALHGSGKVMQDWYNPSGGKEGVQGTLPEFEINTESDATKQAKAEAGYAQSPEWNKIKNSKYYNQLTESQQTNLFNSSKPANQANIDKYGYNPEKNNPMAKSAKIQHQSGYGLENPETGETNKTWTQSVKDDIVKPGMTVAGAALATPALLEGIPALWGAANADLLGMGGTSMMDAAGWYGGYQGATNIDADVEKWKKDKTWANAGNIALDALGVVGGAVSGTNLLKGANEVKNSLNMKKALSPVTTSKATPVNTSKVTKPVAEDPYNLINKSVTNNVTKGDDTESLFGFGKKAKQKKLNKEIALKEDWDKINTEYDIANKAPFLKNPEGKPIMNILNPPKNDGLDNPDYSLVKKLIGEASDPNTARRLKGLGADPEQFQGYVQNNMRFVDDPTEGAYFSPSRNQINMGNATNKDLHFGLQGNKTYPVGGHELYGHGVQEFIGRFNPSRNMSNFPGTTPAQNSTNPTTWLDRAFQDHVRNSAPDSDFIKKHGYSENPDTDYLFNTGPASGQEGVWGIGRGGGNRKSQEAVPYLSEMRREMGGALNRSYDDIFSLDDINAFAKTPTGKTNRVLNTGIPRDHMMASFLDHAPMLGSAIAAGGTLGALSGNNNKNQQGVGSQ